MCNQHSKADCKVIQARFILVRQVKVPARNSSRMNDAICPFPDAVQGLAFVCLRQWAFEASSEGKGKKGDPRRRAWPCAVRLSLFVQSLIAACVS